MDIDDESTHPKNDGKSQATERQRPRRLFHPPRYLQTDYESTQRIGPNYSPTNKKLLNKRRREKFNKATGSDSPDKSAETFIMKLFDHSLDLSKYTEETPLYPICGAWMANQPRNPNIRDFREDRSTSPDERKDNAVEVLNQLKTGQIREIYSMPAVPKAEVVPFIIEKPKPDLDSLDKALKANDDDITENPEFTKEALFAFHKKKWEKSKEPLKKFRKERRKRYQLNFSILKHCSNNSGTNQNH